MFGPCEVSFLCLAGLEWTMLGVLTYISVFFVTGVKIHLREISKIMGNFLFLFQRCYDWAVLSGCDFFRSSCFQTSLNPSRFGQQDGEGEEERKRSCKLCCRRAVPGSEHSDVLTVCLWRRKIPRTDCAVLCCESCHALLTWTRTLPKGDKETWIKLVHPSHQMTQTLWGATLILSGSNTKDKVQMIKPKRSGDGKKGWGWLSTMMETCILTTWRIIEF